MLSLKGKTILNTRAADQAQGFTRMLEGKGAEVIEMPMIELCASDNEEEKKRALDLMPELDWLIFTSVNAVKFFFQTADHYGTEFSYLPNLRIATVGEKTKKTLEEFGYRTNFLPNSFSADMLVKQIPDVEEATILIPRSAKASSGYIKKFEERGAKVIPVTFYENERVIYFKNDFLSIFKKNIDYITFTSGSTAKTFHEYCEKFGCSIKKEKVIAIGPSTESVIKECGMPLCSTAKVYTTDGIIEEIEKDISHAQTA